MSIVRQDPERLSPRHLAVVALVGIAVAALAVWAGALLTPDSLLRPSEQEDPDTPIAGVQRSPLDGPARGLEAHREAHERLTRYGWEDRDAGLAHIPIDRAMELVAEGMRPPGAGEAAR